MAESLLEGECRALVRKAVELALAGDVTAHQVMFGTGPATTPRAHLEFDLPARHGAHGSRGCHRRHRQRRAAMAT